MDEEYFYTTRDIAERLSVSVSTIKNWSSRFPIEKRFDSQGNRRYSEKDLRLFEIIKSLRDEDRGYGTITRRLNTELSLSRSLDNLGDPVPSLGHALDFQPLIREVTEAIQEQNEMGGKLAEAHRTIGQLESRVLLREQQVEELKQQIQELREQVRLLVTAERPTERPADSGQANGGLGALSWLVRRSS